MSEDLNENANKMSPVQPFELKFDNINVVATVDEKVQVAPGSFKKQKAQKTILNKVSGIFEPNTFTAIVGPSGCGKTTMLNLLSGRLLSQNLDLDGEIFVNSKQCFDIGQYQNMIGYIMQEDLLMATFTPRQSFRFVADLRLVNASEEEKSERVEDLIKILGLTKCADTYVGNAMIRGVSGGEKRRVSIGVELLTNPSMIFLDQPTTGLDSTTSLHLMQFLNKIARSGRTIVSTIHQPSSDIFEQFDRLIIMVNGNMVYQGKAKDSMGYFGSIGFPVKKHSNPTDYYMRIMNKEGLALEFLQKEEQVDDVEVKRLFEQRVTYFKDKYAQFSQNYVSRNSTQIVKGKGQGNLNFFGQVYYVAKRAMKDQMINPLNVIIRIIQMVIHGIFCAFLYYRTSSTSYAMIQDVTGCLAFFVISMSFGGIIESISTFSTQRSIFIRERMSNTYSAFSYFVGRNLAYLPLQWFLPFIFIIISYFSSHLNNGAGTFFLQLLALQLTYWMSASYGLVVSTTIKDFDVAISLVPVLIIPFMLVSGYFVSLDQVPKFFYWMQYLSMFKYGYEAVINNQYTQEIDCGNGIYCNILDTKFKFMDPNWLNYFLLAVLGLVFRIISYIALEIISSPKKIKLGKKNQQKMLPTPVSVPMVAESAQVIINPGQNYPNPNTNNQYSNYPNTYNAPEPYIDPNGYIQDIPIGVQQINQPRIVMQGSPDNQHGRVRVTQPTQSNQEQYDNSPSAIKLKENISKLSAQRANTSNLNPVSESMSQLKNQ